ncbi:DUF87 domain-containing protein [Hyphomonas sp.]|uniref:ATP-binding protein n=1 Tax=Hyphomonas sp. TaxID=87 RepID=UPI0025C382D7|nr:DUF87 domain-containing protein [Hyphomonas sp.]
MVLATVLILGAATWTLYRSLLPDNSLSLAVYSLTALLCFSVHLVERYFSKPADVLINAAGVLLVMLPLRDEPLATSATYAIIIIWSSFVLLTAFAASMLFNPDNPNTNRHFASRILNELSTKFGNGKLLFSFSIFALAFYAGTPLDAFYKVAIFVSLLNLVLDKNVLLNLAIFSRRDDLNIGDLFGTVGNSVLKGRLHKKAPVPTQVVIRNDNRYQMGLVVKHHRSLSSTELEILRTTQDLPKTLPAIKENTFVAYIDANTTAPIGYVTSGTCVNELVFAPIESAELSTGRIVEIDAAQKKVYYQIQDAEIASASSDKQNRDFELLCSATQLGTFNEEKQIFEKHDWIPNPTDVVSLPTSFPDVEPDIGEFLLGFFPGTAFKVHVDVEEMLKHHCAILGVTGTGKSVFARDLIRSTNSEKIKYICVDITNEYGRRFGDDIESLIPEKALDDLAKHIRDYYIELQKFANNRDEGKMLRAEQGCKEIFKPLILRFAASKKNIGLIEFADLTGTIQNFVYLKFYFETIFELAKNHSFSDTTICIVLEEAHTIVPEWNFVADSNKAIDALLNSISQIALQGRKYGIGLMVIAQRTANVSKTILTQCNTVIAFQQFDKTSADFLESFVGGNAGKVLPNLKPRTAIATGKGLKSSTPVIFEVREIFEDIYERTDTSEPTDTADDSR